MGAFEGLPISEVIRVQRPVRPRSGPTHAAGEPKIPRPRWWAVLAAPIVLLCSVSAALLIPVRVIEVATPLRADSGVVSAIVRTARVPDSFLGRTVSLLTHVDRLQGRVRTATTSPSPGAGSAAADGTAPPTSAVLIVIAVPAAVNDVTAVRIEIDFGRRSLFADMMGGHQ